MEDAQKPISLTLIFIWVFRTDSGGAEEEMDGWIFSPYCTSCTVDTAESLRAHYLLPF